MARVKLIQNKEDIAPAHYALFDELAALRGRISGPSTVMLHSPGLARPWNEISEYLHRDSIVAAADAELAVSATAREYDSPYVWNAHVTAARRAGVDEATLTAVRDNAPLDGLPANEARMVSFVRQLLRANRVDRDVFDALLRAHDPRWLVELTCWVGRYGALAGVLTSFEVAPAANAEPLPPLETPVTRSAGRTLEPASRLPLLTDRAQLDTDAATAYDAVFAERGVVRGPFALLLYSPPLAPRVLDVNTHLERHAAVKGRDRELAILAVSREKDCPYAWSAHASIAREQGVPAATIALIASRGAAQALAPAEADVFSYVRAVLRAPHTVPQPLFDRLSAAHGVPWLVELTALIGHYGLIGALLNTFEVPPLPTGDILPLT